jgi:hypothetical protein
MWEKAISQSAVQTASHDLKDSKKILCSMWHIRLQIKINKKYFKKNWNFLVIFNFLFTTKFQFFLFIFICSLICHIEHGIFQITTHGQPCLELKPKSQRFSLIKPFYSYPIFIVRVGSHCDWLSVNAAEESVTYF